MTANSEQLRRKAITLSGAISPINSAVQKAQGMYDNLPGEDPRTRAMQDSNFYYDGTSMYQGQALKGSLAEMAENNPYKNMYMEPKFFERLGLGHRAQDYNLELMKSQNEYDAKLAALQEQREYDDPKAARQRMLEAGQNPDLTGDMASGSSATLGEGSSPVLPAGSDFDSFSTLIGTVSGLGGLIADKILQFRAQGAALDAQNLQNASALDSLGDKALDTFFSKFKNSDVSYEDFKTALEEYIENGSVDEWLSGHSLGRIGSSRLGKSIKSLLRSRFADQSNLQRYYRSLKDTEDARYDVAYARSSEYYSDVDSIYSDLLKPLSGAFNNRQRFEQMFFSDYYQFANGGSKASAENAHNAFFEEYQNSLSGSALADAENANAQADSAEAAVRKQEAHKNYELRSVLYSWCHNLYKDSKEINEKTGKPTVKALGAQSLLIAIIGMMQTTVSHGPKGSSISIGK